MAPKCILCDRHDCQPRVGMSKGSQAWPLFCYTGLRGVEKDPRAQGKIVHVRNDEYMS